MNLRLILQHSSDGRIFDISDVAGQIQISDSIKGEAGKLTCLLEKDPNNLLKLANGSKILFIVDDVTLFVGYIFTIGTDAEGTYKITAYDQMRYLKNSDIMSTENMTASEIFEKICKEYQLIYKVKVPTSYIPERYLHSNKTLYTIMERGLKYANINDKKLYFIKDEAGVLVWDELGNNKTSYVLGDKSLVYGYKYEKSIDKDTSNQIKLFKEDTESKHYQGWVVKDSDNIKRWGILQMIGKVDDKLNVSQIKEMAENYLKTKNRELETLSVQAEGVKELRAGKGIRFVLSRENIDRWMWIISATHTFTKYEHTMELELEA